jgi:hypothetical protein
MRGTMTPLLDTLCISNPNRSFGEIDALTDSSAAPTLVSGVVVIRRRDFGIAGMEHISLERGRYLNGYGPHGHGWPWSISISMDQWTARWCLLADRNTPTTGGSTCLLGLTIAVCTWLPPRLGVKSKCGGKTEVRVGCWMPRTDGPTMVAEYSHYHSLR